MVQANINIKVTNILKKELDELKTHPREPYHEIIKKLIDVYQLLSSIKRDSIKDNDFDPADYLEALRQIYHKL